jgi:hypothetical protein
VMVKTKTRSKNSSSELTRGSFDGTALLTDAELTFRAAARLSCQLT